ncbi:hypothetical protein TorRG33x02_261670, partial [Trema orientale]
MSLLDWARRGKNSSYNVTRAATEKAQKGITSLEKGRGWAHFFGLPRRVRSDRGHHNTSRPTR